MFGCEQMPRAKRTRFKTPIPELQNVCQSFVGKQTANCGSDVLQCMKQRTLQSVDGFEFEKQLMSEVLLAGIATSVACVFTNPLEVIKTRVQLQGELKARGQYHIHYRNVFHAFYTIAKSETLVSLQKGLVPAIGYNFVMNGIRLSLFQVMDDSGFTRNEKSDVVLLKSVVVGAFTGVIGSFFGSPFYLAKTRLQAKSCIPDPVGYQHGQSSMTAMFSKLYDTEGLRGLWRGAASSVVRTTIGSAVQMASFVKVKESLNERNMLKADSTANTICSASVSAFVVTAFMTPFDVIATRLYNQPVDANSKKGLMYTGISDCMAKTFASEGITGFYKGWAAVMLRVAPHNVLSLLFWRELRKIYFQFNSSLTIELIIPFTGCVPQTSEVDI